MVDDGNEHRSLKISPRPHKRAQTGVRQLVARVAESIRDWGLKDGYFRSADDATAFHDELVHLLIRQYAAFNSPVWFNVGCDRIEPNSDATNWHWNTATEQDCRIRRNRLHAPAVFSLLHQLYEESLDSILTLAKTEGMLFKWGSGTGDQSLPAAQLD